MERREYQQLNQLVSCFQRRIFNTLNFEFEFELECLSLMLNHEPRLP